MSAQLFEMVAKRALKDTAKKNINSKDPYYEEVAVYGRDGRATGRVKKQKKGIPNCLSQHDGKVLKKVRRQAFRLDMSLFNCCGIRFGWSSVIGIIPVIGDAIDLFLAWLVVKSCCRIDGGLPSAIQYRMYFNILLDFGVGLVPFLGDLADAIFRANTRNAWILEEYLIKKAEAEQRLRQEKERRDQQGRLPGPGSEPNLLADSERPPPKKSMWSWGRAEPQVPHDDQEMGVISGAHGGPAYSGRK